MRLNEKLRKSHHIKKKSKFWDQNDEIVWLKGKNEVFLTSKLVRNVSNKSEFWHENLKFWDSVVILTITDLMANSEITMWDLQKGKNLRILTLKVGVLKIQMGNLRFRSPDSGITSEIL